MTTKKQPVMAKTVRTAAIADRVFTGDQVSSNEPIHADADADEVTDYGQRIQTAYNNSVAALIEVACICADADINLSDMSKTRLLKLPNSTMSRTTFVKLAQIGRSSVLIDPKYHAQLPASMTTLYEMRMLSSAEMAKGIGGGDIRPNSTRGEISKWVSKKENCSALHAVRFRRGDEHLAVDETGFERLATAYDQSPDFQAAWKSASDTARKQFVRHITPR